MKKEQPTNYLKPNNIVELSKSMVCTNVKNYGGKGTVCNIYPKTHKHYKKLPDGKLLERLRYVD